MKRKKQSKGKNNISAALACFAKFGTYPLKVARLAEKGDKAWKEHLKMCKMFFEIELIEEQVKRSWVREKEIHKAIFGKPLRRNAALCQGICRQLKSRLGYIFPITELSIRHKGKTHLILLVKGQQNYIVDGTIKQFLPKEKRNVFLVKEYPIAFENVTEWRLPVGTRRENE